MLIILPYKKVEGDEELLLMLRSLEKNLAGKHKLLIVGDVPDSLKSESYTYIKGNHLKGSFNNVARNVLLGCKWAVEKGYKEALVMNDDIIFMKKMRKSDLKLFVRAESYNEFVRNLSGARFAQHPWGVTNRNTVEMLEKRERNSTFVIS